MKFRAVLLSIIILPFLYSTISFAQQFKSVVNNILTEENVKSFACAWVDYDNDGDLDLFAGNLAELNSLYQNDGKGNFTKVKPGAAGSLLSGKGESFSVSWGDFNNDGLIDAYVSNFNGTITIHKQVAGNRFELVKDIEDGETSYPSQGGSWADVDLDGDLDLLVTNVAGKKNILFINNGTKGFTKSASDVTIPETNSHAAAWGDYNNDCYPDLFIAENYEGVNLFYINEKGTLKEYPYPGQFAEKVVSTGASWVDYDNDGDLDLYVTNSLSKRNFIYRNDRDNKFTKIENSPIALDEANSMAACWGDYDNDGDLDLFVANSGIHNDNYYINNGNGEFTKNTEEIITKDGKASRGCSCGDYDNDGDLDLYVTSGFGQDDRNMFYTNNGNKNSWVKFDLTGSVSNHSAIGARVYVTATINGEKVTQMREIAGTTSAYSQNALQVHFGLGDAKTADITITWPGGKRQQIKEASVNRTYKIIEKSK